MACAISREIVNSLGHFLITRTAVAKTEHVITASCDRQESSGAARTLATPISIDCVPVRDFDSCLRSEWDVIRGSSPAFRSPFFSHTFIDAVGRVSPNNETAVARQAGKVIGLLPFQRSKNGLAHPVALGVNDAHGLLATSDAEVETTDLLRAVGMKSFLFHAAPTALPDIKRYEAGRTRAFLADLTVDPRGYEYYLKNNRDTIDRQGQKTRKLIRTKGPLRLDLDCRDPKMLDHLIELKGQQYRRTQIYDILSVNWIQRLLHDLLRNNEAPVRGLLSVLYAGDDPVAMHFGMLEGNLLHYWFPVYDNQYSYGSPGTVLFLEIAKQAVDQGVRSIDFGYGELPYKYKVCNVVSEMSFGLIDRSPFRRAAYRTGVAVLAQIKKPWIKERLKPLIRVLMPNFGEHRYRT